MDAAYKILGLDPKADDAAVRQKYLELIRTYTPERHPDEFTKIQQAYESLKDLEQCVNDRLFPIIKHETIDGTLEEIACRMPRRRPTLTELLATLTITPTAAPLPRKKSKKS